MALRSAAGVDRVLAELADVLLAMTPAELGEWLDRQPGDVVSIAERALGRRLALGWRADPVSMAHHLTRGAPPTQQVKRWRYTNLLGRKFREAVEGTSPRQIWNLPSRMGKSLILRWGLVWALDRDPMQGFIYTTYGDDLANEGSIFVRDQLLAHADVLRAQLRPDRRRMDRFVTPEGGGLLAAGIRSGMVGFGAHGAVIDDPLKDWIQAHSENERTVVWNQIRSVVRLRLDYEPGWLIVCHTRWHEDDPTGRLQKAMEDEDGEAYEVVRIPALAETHDPRSHDKFTRMADPLDREPGEVIEPERFTAAQVAQRHLSLGSYLTAGLEQQRPSPEEGGDIKRAWWVLASSLPPRFDQTLTSWDMKLKDKEAGDYVVGGVWGRTGSSFWLRDVFRGQWNQATTKVAIVLASVRYPNTRQHVIENTGNGPEVIEELRKPQPRWTLSDDIASQLGITLDERPKVERVMRRGLPGVTPENPKGDKRARMRAYAPLIEARGVHVYEHGPWLGSYLEEMSAFPNGSHDDQVDMTSQALKRLSKGPASVQGPPEGKVPSTNPPPIGRSAPKRPQRGRVVDPRVRRRTR